MDTNIKHKEEGLKEKTGVQLKPEKVSNVSGIHNIAKKWEKSIPNWAEIISRFSIIFKDRLNGYLR